MSLKQSWIIISLFCVATLTWSLVRDVNAERQYSGDLRNRVVGARMQKDGRSPYFYKWKKSDGIRYYDPNNFDKFRVSNATGSPFFHYLFYPVAEWPQQRISVLWLIAEYAMYFTMALLAISLATTVVQQRLIVITAGLFLFTEAWKVHIGAGQNYICIPLLAMIFYCCIRNQRSLLMAFIAGLAVAALLLIRPTFIIFFLPFVLVWRNYSKRYLLFCVMPLLCAIAWIGSSSYQRFLWKEYSDNLSQQLKIHQRMQPDLQTNEPDPAFTVWEGVDKEESKRQANLHPLHFFSENGNFFVVAAMFHVSINTRWLMILSAASIACLFFYFYRFHRTTGFYLPAVAIAGFCLYMLTDLFSPIYRHQYYVVQWLFPIYLAAAVYDKRNTMIYCWLLAGLLLNIANIPFLPMEHTIGEYIMLAGFIVLSLRRQTGLKQ